MMPAIERPKVQPIRRIWRKVLVGVESPKVPCCTATFRESGRAEALCRCLGVALAPQYTKTAVPIGSRLLAQIQSMASLLTLTHPWDTGVGGTDESPWMA